MERYINEEAVLDFYLGEIDKDNIRFLSGRDKYKDEIRSQILKLKAENEVHDKICICKDLWKIIFEAAMTYIDPDKRGYDNLFKYIDEYVNFEELIFASDSFYRDHTMHCLWVYFLGEYIAKSENFSMALNDLYKDYHMIAGICEMLKLIPHRGSLDNTIKSLGEISSVIEYSDSIRCINALTHDLGYPIKKINMINKSMKNILPYFGLNSFNEFSFQYNNIQNGTISKFIEFLSSDLSFNLASSDNEASGSLMRLLEEIFVFDENTGHIVGFDKSKLDQIDKKDIELLGKNIRTQLHLLNDYSSYLRYNADFEEYQHGIMSAFLLVKILKAFETVKLRYSDYINLEGTTNFRDVYVKKAILSSISDHTSSGYQITGIVDYQPFLTFVDELEEFSRMSRANQNRQYINEFCKTDIYMDGEYFNIDFIFDNSSIEGLDPEKSFKGKCKRFLTLFNINELDENLKIKFRCISRLPCNNNIYTLELSRKYVNILINDIEQDIPVYLNSKQFYTKEEYMDMK